MSTLKGLRDKTKLTKYNWAIQYWFCPYQNVVFVNIQETYITRMTSGGSSFTITVSGTVLSFWFSVNTCTYLGSSCYLCNPWRQRNFHIPAHWKKDFIYAWGPFCLRHDLARWPALANGKSWRCHLCNLNLCYNPQEIWHGHYAPIKTTSMEHTQQLVQFLKLMLNFR